MAYFIVYGPDITHGERIAKALGATHVVEGWRYDARELGLATRSPSVTLFLSNDTSLRAFKSRRVMTHAQAMRVVERMGV